MTEQAPPELWELASLYCDGDLAAEDAAHLSEFLRASEQHAVWFASFMNLHGQLQWDVRAAGDEHVSRFVERLANEDRLFEQMLSRHEESLPPEKRLNLPAFLPAWLPERYPGIAAAVAFASSSWFLMATAAALLFWAGMMVVLLPGNNREDRGLAEQPVVDDGKTGTEVSPARVADRVSFAQLTAAKDCRWGGGLSFAPGHSLRAGRYELQRGVAEITFPRGVRIELESPCEFELTSADETLLHVGRLVATVPPAGVGFAVQTEAARIIDLGTEFGVLAEASGRTGVHVFRGVVDVLPRGQEYELIFDGQSRVGRQRLEAGEAAWATRRNEGIRDGAVVDASSFRRRGLRTTRPESAAEERVVAYVVPSTAIGTQAFVGTLGMDFDVLDPIDVHRLGVFDYQADGFGKDTRLNVAIWSRDNGGTAFDPADDRPGQMLAALDFSAAEPGERHGSNRLKALAAPLRLAPGSYTVVACGFNERDPNGNSEGHGTAAGSFPWFTNDGRGRLMFVGAARFGDLGDAGFPDKVDGGPANRYAAGTFEFSFDMCSQSSEDINSTVKETLAE